MRGTLKPDDNAMIRVQPVLSTALTVGEVILVLRHRRRWDQKTLAAKAGLSATYISDIERNAHDPSYKTRQKLAHALAVPVTTLLEAEMKEDDP